MLGRELIRGFLGLALFLGFGGPRAAGDVRVLFLGDDGLHQPAARAEEAREGLAREGIVFDYTNDQDALSPARLKKYDCLLMYHNVDALTPKREAALLEFVREGGGLAVIHCGSYAYGNSPAYTALVGARFDRHGDAIFRARIVDAQHPAMAGAASYEGWDETYVHRDFAPDIRVLMVREEEGHTEPYAWVREEGKGRVYYNALGHDARAWQRPEFQRMLAQGILWAAARTAPGPAAPGARAAKLPSIEPETPEPLSPEESMRRMHLPEGFRVELFAAEPEIVKPIAFAFDARGRCWIVESLDYPNRIAPNAQGRDRIKICEDTDGDGRADRFTVFREPLNIPTTLLPVDGGLLVGCAPDILLLRDTDGDDVADEERVLFTGFRKHDTHAVMSNFRLGFDNWIWATIGYSGAEIETPRGRLTLSQGIFRFKPDGSEIEYVTLTTNNTWGLGFDERGEVFASTANNQHSVHLGVPNRFTGGIPRWTAPGNFGIANHTAMHPIARFRQFDHVGGYSAAAGHAFYTARRYPREFWGRAAFVCEPTGHLIHIDWLVPKGATFIAVDGYNLLASTDEWTAPIAAEVGPDGNVWFIDWYNFIVRHNPTPPGFETGTGNAYVTGERDDRHGRIYRIVHEDAGPPDAIPDIESGDAAALIAALKHPNLFWRLHAQHRLVSGRLGGAIPDLAEVTRHSALDGIGLNPGALHALFAMAGLGAFDARADEWLDTGLAALRHPLSPVRAAALRVLPASDAVRHQILAANLPSDPDSIVQREALLALSMTPESADAGHRLATLADLEIDGNDPMMRQAMMAAASRHASSFLLDALKRSAARAEDIAPADENPVPNPSMEKEESGRPAHWMEGVWSGSAVSRISTRARTGKHAAEIVSENGADYGLLARVPVRPNTEYRLSGWIRTEKVQPIGGARGALLNVHNLQPTQTKALTGTTPWTQVEVVFNSGALSQLEINCLFGGWGRATGTAWFDDIRLEAVSPVTVLTDAIRWASRRYGAGGGDEHLAEILALTARADPRGVERVVHALRDTWPDTAPPAHSPALEEAVRGVLRALDEDRRIPLLHLLRRWKFDAPFADAYPAAVHSVSSVLRDPLARPEAIADAAVSLVRLEDTAQTLDTIGAGLDIGLAPETGAALIRALGESAQPGAAAMLLERWPHFTPALRAPALEVLLRRPASAAALLAAIESGAVRPDELTLEQAQRLAAYPDAAVAGRAAAVLVGAGRVPSAERQAMLDARLAAAALPGDPAHGAEIFEQNCVRCHRFAGKGIHVGPDLDAINVADKRALLLEILDPNRSVEGNYRQWQASTRDFETFAGRLINETQSAVELLAPGGERHVLNRADIEDLVMTPFSLMPEGFESLSDNDLAHLLAHLERGIKPRPVE